MVKKIQMDINETLELDYVIEQITNDVVEISSEPSADALSLSYISKETSVLNPTETGTYEIDIDGQVIEIEVTDIPDSGISHWDFENSNNDDSLLKDQWGTNSGTVSGATYLDNGGTQGNGAYSFDGDNDGIALDSNISFSSSDAWSLVVLAKVDTTRGQHRAVGKSGDDDNHIRFTPSNDTLGLEGDANGVGSVTHTYSDTYELYSVTHSATSGNVRFYANDSDLGTASPAGTGFVLNNIGKGTSSSDIFKGECAGVWMYGRELSNSEVKQLYNEYI
jgi:hypothetical protein